MGDQGRLRDERFCGEQRADVNESERRRERDGKRDVARRGCEMLSILGLAVPSGCVCVCVCI